MSFRKIYKSSFKNFGKNSNRHLTPVKTAENDQNSMMQTRLDPLSFPDTPLDYSFMINLEDLLVIESNLSFVLEKFNYSSSVISACEDIWQMTADNTLNHVNQLFRNEKTRNAIRYSMVLQTVGVALTHYFISEYALHHDMSLLIKSILFSIHQAFLILTKFILSRVPSDNSNLWAQKLRQIIKEKKLRKHNIDNTSFLEHYSLLIINNLKKMCRNFISKAEDPIVKALKLSVLQIIRNRGINIVEARNLIENAFGNKIEALEQKESKIKPPFLPLNSLKPYTLVLDLDETLVHYIDNINEGKYLARPYAKEFLQSMSQYYELVIFTAAIQDYAD